MTRVRTRITGLCFRLRKARIRVSLPKLQSNPAYNSIKESHSTVDGYYDNDCGSSFSSSDDKSMKSQAKEKLEGNRIMIVVDPSREAKGALQWALSHTVQKEDTIILLHIAKSSKTGSNSESDVNPKVYGLLYSMKGVEETSDIRKWLMKGVCRKNTCTVLLHG